MDSGYSRPSRELVRKLLGAGADAGKIALEAAHKATAQGVDNYVARIRSEDVRADDEALVDRIIKAHVRLARAEGAAAGGALSWAEATTVIGTAGTLTVPSNVLITMTDLTGLVWIQLRMALTIAAMYGHDPTETARLREFMSLQGALPAVAAPLIAEHVGKGAGRVGTRILNRYLRGPLLASITSLFRMGGIRFSRAALLRQVFVLNIPANMVINDSATRRLGTKARDYYITLPAASSSRDDAPNAPPTR